MESVALGQTYEAIGMTALTVILAGVGVFILWVERVFTDITFYGAGGNHEAPFCWGWLLPDIFPVVNRTRFT